HLESRRFASGTCAGPVRPLGGRPWHDPLPSAVPRASRVRKATIPWDGPPLPTGDTESAPCNSSVGRSHPRGWTLKYFPRVLHYLRPYWKLAALSVVLLVLAALAGLLAPWPLQILFDNVLQDHPLPTFLADMLGPVAENRHALLLFAVAS